VGNKVPELERLAEAYSCRRNAGRYSPFEKAHLAMLQEVERVALGMLANTKWESLSGRVILDVGCGKGFWLRRMLDWGAEPANLHGLDALPGRVKEAVSALPAGISLSVGDASLLPWKDGTFDLVSQFVMFSSILDSDVRLRVAQEMVRVLRPGGRVLWYDFYRDNPRNPDVTGINRKEIKRLFPECKVTLRRVTLAPPLARWLSRRMPWAHGLLGRLEFLRTHYVGMIIINKSN
jgi:ubiquinone/menaquinone biosynthesis C-methylase UbiE